VKFNTCRKYKTATAAYGLFVVWAFLTFLTIPFARAVQKYVAMHLGRSAFGYAMLAVIGGSLFLIGFYSRKRQTERLSIGNFLWILGVAAIYVYFTLRLWKNPEESVHFLEYGLLSYFAYSALTCHVKDITVFFSASLLVLFVGTLDEIIQWLVPGRFWDIRDVGFNFLGGVLLQIAVCMGFRPKSIAGPVKAKSIRILSAISAAVILLLGLCASNTPYRISLYTDKLPSFSYLRTNHAMMGDYGYKHRDSTIGIFYSRYSKEDLRKQDRLKRIHYSDILNSTDTLEYGRFLWRYNPFTNPFLYEMRIHLYRRDRYMVLVEGGQRSGAALEKNATIAFRENLILEKYFGETLRKSRYRWTFGENEFIGFHADTEGGYESPVSSDLFTLFSERQLWAFILGLLTVLFIVNLKMTKGNP
jgi:glycopeptide antibiotics resistance protein